MTGSYFQKTLLVILIVIISCNDKPRNEKAPETVAQIHSPSPEDYDFSNPVVVRLKKKLKEISGIVYIGDNQLAAIEDETGTLFVINYSTGDIIDSFEFAGKGDFEDVAADDQYYYVLESQGVVYRVPKASRAPATSYRLSSKKKREFESLFMDEENKKLVLLCKECKHQNDIKEGYCFDLQSLEFSKNSCLSIDLRPVEKSLPAGTLLKPSAAAINPADHKLYVVCSVGKALLRCTRDGKIEKRIALDEKIFRQPEGLAFTPKGDMMISNEAAGEHPTLVKISRSSKSGQ